MQLREYQHQIIKETRALFNNGIKSVAIQSPTGSGKTILAAQMLKTASSKGFGSMFLVHRREIVNQTIEAFKSLNIPHGVIASGYYPNPQYPVQIASIQTLARRIESAKAPGFIVIDEFHHLAAKNWDKVYCRFPNAFKIGLSATPARLDGKGLGKYFQKMVHGPSVRWLIDNKYLADYKIYAPATVNLKGVHRRMGDYATNELASTMDKPSITGCAVEHYKRLTPGKRAVVFAVSIEHSKHIVEQFRKEGINAAHIDGETDKHERDAKLKEFKNGTIKVVSNVELFGEGFDLPCLDVGILLRPTHSEGLFLQQIGRTLRPSANKEIAIILDHSGNCLRHGLPDEERNWSLDGLGKVRGNGEQTVHIRTCPKCFAVQKPEPSCKFCGFIFEVQSRQVDQKEGELVEITANQIIAKADSANEMWQAKTFEQLVALGIKRRYKSPTYWAKCIMISRARKYARS